jgi:hypothetical protein
MVRTLVPSLPELLGGPEISPHIHDADLGTYLLHSGGVEIDQFNPIPVYLSDGTSPEKRSSWAGNPTFAADIWKGVDAATNCRPSLESATGAG